MDVLCADKTGTLTRNALEVVDVVAMPGFDRARVLALAALASSEADQDPIDAAIRAAAKAARRRRHRTAGALRSVRSRDQDVGGLRRRSRWTRASHRQGRVRGDRRAWRRRRRTRGARSTISPSKGTGSSPWPRARRHALRLVGLIALSDPPREDSAGLIATLRDMGVRTVMVTGDSAVTAAAIARKVGIAGAVCPPERFPRMPSTDEFGVFARVVPEEKYRLVKALQSHGHVVGMCGDGTNDAPALRQAQIGIAVSSATDVAKAAAGMVMTEPGLAGIVFAVREGRIGIPAAAHLHVQHAGQEDRDRPVPGDRARPDRSCGLDAGAHGPVVHDERFSQPCRSPPTAPAPRRRPSVWRMRNITAAAVVLGLCKLGFSTAVLAFGKFQLGLDPAELQTLAFVTLVFGNQAVLYVLRERRRMWSSKPGNWVLASSVADIAIVSAARAVRNLDGAAGVAGHCGRIRRRDRVRADPRSDQAAGHVGVQGRTTSRAMEICARDAPIDLQQIHACQRPEPQRQGEVERRECLNRSPSKFGPTALASMRAAAETS